MHTQGAQQQVKAPWILVEPVQAGSTPLHTPPAHTQMPAGRQRARHPAWSVTSHLASRAAGRLPVPLAVPLRWSSPAARHDSLLCRLQRRSAGVHIGGGERRGHVWGGGVSPGHDVTTAAATREEKPPPSRRTHRRVPPSSEHTDSPATGVRRTRGGRCRAASNQQGSLLSTSPFIGLALEGPDCGARWAGRRRRRVEEKEVRLVPKDHWL